MTGIRLSQENIDFVTERHLASLTIVTSSGRPHVTPVGFTWDDKENLIRVITWAGSTKAKILQNSATLLRAAVCQVDGGRWITFEGDATVTADPERCSVGISRYAERYSPPKDRGEDRRMIEIRVDRLLGRNT
tara:strand:- start:141 stop:539 length:399 start_codon:yes stop_codon:yes gene_type:complete